MNIRPDLLNDDLSSAMGTETLLAHDLVPERLPASSKWPAEQQIHYIEEGGQNSGHRSSTLPFPFRWVSVGRRRSPRSGTAEVSRGEIH
jgi:hypothetical protein